MRVITTLVLSLALGLTAWAGGEGYKAKKVAWGGADCAVTNSCRNKCPVAREATTLGRLVAMEMPVATVARGELEA